MTGRLPRYAERGEYGRATNAWLAATYTYPEVPQTMGHRSDQVQIRGGHPSLERLLLHRMFWMIDFAVSCICFETLLIV